MIFIQARIDAFGKWVDTTFQFNDNNLNCFYGENESGKTTLQQFILFMLFGLAPRKRKAFRPKHRNEIGGALTLKSTNIGTVTIIRKEGSFTCHLENGEIKDQNWWNNDLKGLTREVYTSIYAFAATDLGAIRTMDKEQISDVLFSIGLSGSTAIYNVDKNISAKMDALYKRQGRKPLINKQINKITGINEKLEIEKEKERAYQPLKHHITQLEQEIKADQIQQHKQQKKLIVLGKIKQAIPVLQEYQSHARELSKLPNKIPFPEDGLKRLEKLKSYVLPLQSEENILQSKVQEYREKYNEIAQQLFKNDVIQEAEALLDGKSAYDKRNYVIQENEKRIILQEDKLNHIYRTLEWEKDETAEISFPFHLETSWGDIQNSNSILQEEAKKLDEEMLMLENKNSRLLMEASELRKQFLPPKQLHEIEEHLQQDTFNKKNKHQMKQWQQWKEKQFKTTKNVLYGAGILSIFSLMAAFFTDYTLLYIISFLLILLGTMQYFFANQNNKSMENVFQHSTGTSSLPQSKREHYESLLQLEKKNQEQMEHIKNEQKEIEYIRLQWNERNQLHKQKQQQLSDRLATERAQFPFLNDIRIIHWMELLDMIRELKKVQEEKDVYEKENQSLQKRNNRIEESIRQFPHAVSFEGLANLLDQQHSKEQLLSQYEQEIEQISEKSVNITEQIKLYEYELKQLFERAHVEDEETFYEMANLLVKKANHQKAIQQIVKQLNKLFPTETVEELLHEKTDEIELENKEKVIMDKIGKIEEKIKENNHSLATAQIQLEQLERMEDPSLLAYQYEMEKNLLNEQAKQWSVLKLAQSALDKAKQSYQEKYLSDVIGWTTTFFEKLTNGNYTSVYAPSENKLFQVEGKEHIRYTIDELSQGTIDQLYVSLRFAIAKVMSDMYTVPILIDDAFVHFDDIRTEQAMEVVKEIATEKQIIFFTCKKEIAKSLQANPLRQLIKEVTE